ncbi:hypothetical protein BLJAPNOD_04394 [Ensifer sp. M14]|nr:hypothetical protein BLJAPNOD_04394 [Ensifer sp. M14]
MSPVSGNSAGMGRHQLYGDAAIVRLIRLGRNVSGRLRCGTRTGAFRLDVPCQGRGVVRYAQASVNGFRHH